MWARLAARLPRNALKMTFEPLKRIFERISLAKDFDNRYTGGIKQGEVIPVLDFVLANLPILICMIAGMALIVVEVFLPGFGLPGISGIVLLLVSIGVSAANYGAMAGLGMTIVVLAVLAIVVSISLKSAARGTFAKSPLVLNVTESSDAGYDSVADMQVFLDRSGEALTVLRPVGIAEFDGVRLNVVTEGDYIEKGQRVTIVQVEGGRIVVRKADESAE